MPTGRVQPSTSEAAQLLSRSTEGTRVRGSSRVRSWFWRRALALLACGLAAGYLTVLAWFELQPAALVEADAAFQRGDVGTALRIARGHLARRPASRHATLLVARCLSRMDRPVEAEPYYQRSWPIDLQDRHLRAYAFVVNNMREAAIIAYQEIHRLWPEDVLALSRLASVLILDSRWYDAMGIANRLVKMPAGTVIGHTLAGVVHHNTGEFEEAVDDFSRILELDPDLKQMPLKPRSIFWSEFGKSLLLMGRAEEAQRYLHRALREGDDASVADLLGQSYYLQGALDDAEQCWRLALQLDPERPGAWWRLGKLELQRGRPAEAIEPLRRSSALEPEAIGPLYDLSLAYRRLGQNEESAKFSQQANRLRGKNLDRKSREVNDRLFGTEETSSRSRAGESWRPKAESASVF
jgi:tetratricopeptide (TPR) repeat protein